MPTCRGVGPPAPSKFPSFVLPFVWLSVQFPVCVCVCVLFTGKALPPFLYSEGNSVPCVCGFQGAFKEK